MKIKPSAFAWMLPFWRQITNGGILLFMALSLLLGLTRCALTPDRLPSLPPTPANPTARIALLVPTGGEMATFGRMLRNGSMMAFDEWNSRGGVLGQRLEWVDYDTPCDFEAARQSTQQAVAAGFHLLIGPLCSESAIAVAIATEENTALLIAPAATHPLVTLNGRGQTRPTVFRAGIAWPLQGQAAARFAYESLKTHKAALMFDPDDDYAVTLTEAFTQQFVAQGGRIVQRIPYNPNISYSNSRKDFVSRRDDPVGGNDEIRAALQAGKAAGAELLYLPADAATVNRVNHQRRELGLAGRDGLIVLGSDSWESSDLDLSVAEGEYFTLHFFLEDNRPATRRWAEAYKAIYATAPNTLAVSGFEAATLMAAAITQANSLEVEKIAAALEQDRFEGITGPFTFDYRHNPVKPVPVAQIKDGKIIFSTYLFRNLE